MTAKERDKALSALHMLKEASEEMQGRLRGLEK
jgi:hypothetical protein